MTVNFNGVVRMMSVLFLVLGFAMLPALLVALIYGEQASVIAFLITMIHCIALGLLFWKIYKPSQIKLKVRDSFLIVSLCWIIASMIGALPFVMSGAMSSYVDAFFETCSGFSTTGATTIYNIEALPKSILFWRSFTQWLGGMGIIVFAAIILPSIGIKGQIMASAETTGPLMEKIAPRFADNTKDLYLIYLLFTMVLGILFLLGGMNPLDALIHTFSTVSTGGFSAYNDGISHFTSPFIRWSMIVFMFLCGINLHLYFTLVKKGIKQCLKDSELKLYLALASAVTACVFLSLLVSRHGQDVGKTFTDAAFQVISIISTTGHTTANYEIWPTFCQMLLFILMLVGACSSSTGGGVKVIRVLVALKLVRRGVSLKLHPNRFVPVTLGQRALQQEVSTNIVNFIFLYIFTVFGGALLISLDGFDLMTSISSVISCVGNIGPGFSWVGPNLNYAVFSNFSKIVLALLMIAGRLELFTFFILFSPHYWNANKV